MWKVVLGAVAATSILCSCAIRPVAPTVVDCPPLPDASQTLAAAWHAIEPDQPLSSAVTVRDVAVVAGRQPLGLIGQRAQPGAKAGLALGVGQARPHGEPSTAGHRLFALQALLLSSGMYHDQGPADPADVYRQ